MADDNIEKIERLIMLKLPIGLLLLIISAIMIKKEARRFANAVCLMASLVLITEGGVALYNYFYPPVRVLGYDRVELTQSGELGSLLWILLTLAVFIMGIALIVNGIILIKKERLTAAHMLPVFFGMLCIGLIILYYGYLFYITSVEEPNNLSYLIAYLIGYLQTAVLYVPFTLLAYLLYSYVYRCITGKTDPDYLIVLGASLSGNSVSPLLAKRLDKAVYLFHKYGDRAYFIVSGGRGSDEKVSEAEAMRNYLTKQNIPKDKIRIEDKSGNTYQNMKFSKDIIEKEPGGDRQHGIFTTNNFHVLRSATIARRVGLSADGVGCGTAGYYYPAASIREAIAFIFGYKKLAAGYLLLVLIYDISQILLPDIAWLY